MATEAVVIPDNKRFCKCGCGELIDKFDKRGREVFYKFAHAARGKKWTEEAKHRFSLIKTGVKTRPHTEEAKRKISEAKKGKKFPELQGSNSPNWKGDNASYCSIHEYLRKHTPKPKQCPACGKETTRLDLACITEKYSRNISDYKYLCHSCHFKLDHSNGRWKNKVPEDRKCCDCGSMTTSIDKLGRARWYLVNRELNLFRCDRCYKKHKRNIDNSIDK